jgi:hypothetical protein
MTGIGGSEIQPGESATCDVVSNVLTSAVAQVPKAGNLDVLNFGDDFPQCAFRRLAPGVIANT